MMARIITSQSYYEAWEFAQSFLDTDVDGIWVMRWRGTDNHFVITVREEVRKVWAVAEVWQYIDPKVQEHDQSLVHEAPGRLQ